ncbi:MAG: hypothetical protein ACRDL7_14810, partial [Gaiellaceae bacterium]
ADQRGNTYVLLANPDSTHAASVRITMPANATAQVLHHAELRPGVVSAAGSECVISLAPMDAATVIIRPRTVAH